MRHEDIEKRHLRPLHRYFTTFTLLQPRAIGPTGNLLVAVIQLRVAERYAEKPSCITLLPASIEASSGPMSDQNKHANNVIDGKAIAAALRSDIGRRVAILKERHQITPGLAVVLVVEDPASQVYVRNKEKQAREAGISSIAHRLSVHTSQEELMTLVQSLNADSNIHGILVQLPLPCQID